MNIGSLLLVAMVALVALPVIVLVLECLAALAPRRRQVSSASVARPRIDVLIPAHDESAVIEATLAHLQPQLGPEDRLWVVADNCSDDTAQIARRAGARVVERHHPDERGKGYALDFGLQHMRPERGDVVVIVDADCRVEPGSLEALARQAVVTGGPVQAAYRMLCPASPQPQDIVSEFAVTLKNLVRPRGTDRLRWPCLLTGSGMAFPWYVISAAHLKSGNIVEDMQLAYDLLERGYTTTFCHEAVVSAPLPRLRSAALSQRMRWEHGHLQTLFKNVPRLVWRALQWRRGAFIAAALDLSIPPLSLLVSMWLVAEVAALLTGTIAGLWWPALVLSCVGALMAGVLVAVLVAFGRRGALGATLWTAPRYVLGKLPIYLRFLTHPQRAWLRTQRDSI